MKRNGIKRVTPESIGIKSSVFLNLIEALDNTAEMHGLMVMRHGKVCLECWWAPYAPGIRHGCQSLTKLYTATAIGIAINEGLLELDHNLIDIMTEFMPESPSENLKKLRVRDILCMGCGMDEMPVIDEAWIKSFFAMPINHEPGSSFMYNTAATSILVAIIKKLTGLGIHEYLIPRLYQKIGINYLNHKWIYMPDKLEMGGAGLFSTTEDNLRLAQLYLQKGVWEGERILTEEFVEHASIKQIDTKNYRHNGMDAIDHLLGYGFQTWMCQPKGVYRGDGAFGQFAIIFPEQDMTISINSTVPLNDPEMQKPLDAIYKHLLPYLHKNGLPEDSKSYSSLQKKISCLSLQKPDYKLLANTAYKISGEKYVIEEGLFTLYEDQVSFEFAEKIISNGINWFSFNFKNNLCFLTYFENGKEETVEVGIDGSRRFNRIYNNETPISDIYLNGVWESENVWILYARWIETCYEKRIIFKFNDHKVEIESYINVYIGEYEEPKKAKARAKLV